MRDKAMIALGRALEQGDLAKKDAESTRMAAEEMQKEITKSEIQKKMRDGTF